MELKVIDLTPIRLNLKEKYKTAAELGHSCRNQGFFYVTGHGVSEHIQETLEDTCRKFFELPLEEKMKIHMNLGGKAWRGYFGFGEELTSGQPDQKEGLYFGDEHTDTHPLVRAGTPLHGKNLYPVDMPELKNIVASYQSELTKLGHVIMEGIALSLGLNQFYFYENYTKDPTILFQVMHYPAARDLTKWAISEHTDYGLLTILKQDQIGGLEVKCQGAWTPAVPIPGTFVCNIGDMLDRMTGGLYKSTLHRVHSPKHLKSRISFPFFFDPNFSSNIKRVPTIESTIEDESQRWDKESVHKFEGTYGNYLIKKVSRVFPNLKNQVLA